MLGFFLPVKNVYRLRFFTVLFLGTKKPESLLVDSGY